MKILITGITGFVGTHLAAYGVTKHNVKIYGTVLPQYFKREIKKFNQFKKNLVHFFPCDLTEKKQVEAMMQKVKPDVVFHLAGQSRVSLSWDLPEKTVLGNIASDLHLFEAARQLKIKPVIVVAGSSETYGLTLANELPIGEDNPLRPMSPYAVSKITQEKLGFQYYKSYGLKIVLTKFFNTEGPGRGEEFVTSSFAKQIAEIEKGKRSPVMHVGNLDAKRDFTDVRDVTKAYWLAWQKCEFGEPYNVCSGKARSIQSVLDTLLALSTRKDIQMKKDQKRMRPSDIPVTVGDYSKFKKQTGWEPKIPFEKTMEDLLNYWREKL